MSALPHNEPLPAGDPAKAWWTYDDLAVIFGLSHHQLRRTMTQWMERSFPAPLPWSHKEKRWKPQAVLAWKRRQERDENCDPPPSIAIAAPIGR